MVLVALSAVAERLSKMAKDDKKDKFKGPGFFKDMFSDLGVDTKAPGTGVGPGFLRFGTSRAGIPGIQFMGKFIPVSDFKKVGGGGGGGGKGDGNGKDEEDEDKKDKVKNRVPGIRDVDFSMEGKISRTNPLAPRGDKEDNFSRPIEPIKKMKSGGLVRGAGCAQRGRGKGKMV